MSKPYDIMVIGGGILGLSSARHLLTHLPNLKIGIIEKGISLVSELSFTSVFIPLTVILTALTTLVSCTYSTCKLYLHVS